VYGCHLALKEWCQIDLNLTHKSLSTSTAGTRLSDRFKSDDRFVMVSLSLDKDAKDVTAFLKKRPDHPESIQGFLGEWTAEPVTKAWGVDAIPSIFFVGPDGKIVARDLRGVAIEAAVVGAIGAK
jgi:hypothetical protein